MARYIDAVKTTDIISERLNIPLGDLVDVFTDIPTADVEEVVRCKDCVCHEKGCFIDTHPYVTPDDGYCYKGKRREK